ncbi:MAG: hypothetical protein DRI90_24890 [Deltaproteobacteria bacterium]|nr:MAG: hypothetical protein DRI90_24890 [Deltaproteobacteria bacterium]
MTVSVLGLGVVGCTSPSVTGVIEGEPVCPDFAVGASGTMMKGSLRMPVQAAILDGSTVRWERLLLGRRLASDGASKFVVEDDDETYKVRWAQCPNVFAPKRIDSGGSRDADLSSTFTCGEAKVYKELELHIKSGEASSRVLEWVVPPEAECWASVAPDQAGSASASASAAPADDAPEAAAEPSASTAATGAASASAAPPGATSAAAAPGPAASTTTKAAAPLDKPPPLEN